MIQDYATTYHDSVLVALTSHACMHSEVISIIKNYNISKTFSGTFKADVFRKFVQGIMSLANLCKDVTYLGRGAKKTSQTTVMISDDEIHESDLHASSLPFCSLFVWVLTKCLFWLFDVTLFKTAWLGAWDFYLVIVQRSVHNSENK